MSTTPMTPTQWTTRLAAEGVNAVGYKSWTTHGRDTATGKVFGPVNGVTIHHTAGRDSVSLCYNGTSSLPGPLCHAHLDKAGLARLMSVRRANHAGTFAQNAHNAVLNESSVHPYPDSSEPVDGNDHYYGIEIENLGNGTDPYPWVQYVAAVKWATAICRHHGWTQDSVIGHKEGTRRKIDPKGPVQGPDGKTFDFTMNRFRADVKAALALPAGQWQGAPKEEEDVALSAGEIKDIWYADLIPAVDEPYENSDWHDGNKTWTAKYALHAAVRASREAQARTARMEPVLAALKDKVDSLATGGVDLDALAVKVADELSRRLSG